MIDHQFSKHFKIDTDLNFKNVEFEKSLADFMVGFIQCYPHLVEKTIRDNVEVWIFKFSVQNEN